MPYVEKTKYDKVDSRMLSKLMKVSSFSSSLSSEQKTDVLRRIDVARLSPDAVIVYDAVRDGYTSLDSLPVATGLSSTQITGAIQELVSGGKIQDIKVIVDVPKT